jgi:xanthine dehydrogenase accessory factor
MNLYSQLLNLLTSGTSAAIVTEYPTGGTAVKRLVSSQDTEAWDGLAALAPGLSDHTIQAPVWILEGLGSRTLVELFTPRPRLVLLGGGHIALPLTELGAMVDFDVVVFDDRPSFANRARFPLASEVICDAFENVAARLALSPSDSVVVITRGHQHDAQCLQAILGSGANPLPGYIGMIGSRRRVAIVLDGLEAQGISRALLDTIHTPIGLSIGSVTPAEIAVSIIAEVIAAKRLVAGGKAGKGVESSDLDLVDWLADPANTPDAIATIVATRGSTPREAGAKMAICLDGTTVGSIGGGCAESDVIAAARQLARDGGFSVMTVDMSDTADDDGMVCGGTMDVIIEAVAL